MNRKIHEAKRMFILMHGTWKENIRSEILNWRQISTGRSSEWGETPLVSQAKGRDPLVTQADLSVPRMCSPAVALLHNKGPRHRRKRCANSFWLYYYYTQSSPSKNKDINYICIYLRVFRCLSSGEEYNNCIGETDSHQAPLTFYLRYPDLNLHMLYHWYWVLFIYKYSKLYVCINKVSKVGDVSRGWPEGSLFDSYYTNVWGRALYLFQDWSTLPLIHTL